MPLQILFGDDEHTAKDGPYSRVLKTRKWLYATTALGALVALGLYDQEAMGNLVVVAALPEWLLRQTLLGGLAYLAIQYLLLCTQLWVSYDIILKERLAFRREDDLALGRQKLHDARLAASAYKDERPEVPARDIQEAEMVLASAEAKLHEAKAAAENGGERVEMAGGIKLDLAGMRVATAETDFVRASTALATLQKKAERLDAARRQKDPIKSSLEASERVAAAALLALQKEDPARRTGYRKIEMAIDVLRVSPPLLVAIPLLIALIKQSISA